MSLLTLILIIYIIFERAAWFSCTRPKLILLRDLQQAHARGEILIAERQH